MGHLEPTPMSFDFDAWRDGYDSMTWSDHVATYSKLHELFPIQRHFDAEACGEFLNLTRPADVWEIGGWDGELAAAMLATRPWIQKWTNVDACPEVVEGPVCTDPRYEARLGPAILAGAGALVMSHVAEHLRWEELKFIFTRTTRVKAIYLASPLPTDGSPPDWDHYPGTHILEVGWDSISAFLGGLGLRQMDAPRSHEVRCWRKIGAAGQGG